jgi:hypothetical protein
MEWSRLYYLRFLFVWMQVPRHAMMMANPAFLSGRSNAVPLPMHSVQSLQWGLEPSNSTRLQLSVACKALHVCAQCRAQKCCSARNGCLLGPACSRVLLSVRIPHSLASMRARVALWAMQHMDGFLTADPHTHTRACAYTHHKYVHAVVLTLNSTRVLVDGRSARAHHCEDAGSVAHDDPGHARLVEC